MHTHEHVHRALRMSTACFSSLHLLANMNFKHIKQDFPHQKAMQFVFPGKGRDLLFLVRYNLLGSELS